jgi:hypothetical protein
MTTLPRVHGIEDGKNILSYYFSDNDRMILLSGEAVLEEMRLPPQAQIAQHQLPADSIFFIAAGMARVFKDDPKARVSKDDPRKEEGKEKPTPPYPRAGPASSSQATGWRCEFNCAFSGTYDEVTRHEKTCVKRPPAPETVEISTEMSRRRADAVHGASQLTISASRFGRSDEDRVARASTEHTPVHSTSSPLARVVTKADSSFNVDRRRVVRNNSSYHSDPEGLARAKSAWIDFEEDEIGDNQILLGAGCCFNDIEFLLQDAGFESNNFGNLKTVTKVSCYRLR